MEFFLRAPASEFAPAGPILLPADDYTRRRETHAIFKRSGSVGSAEEGRTATHVRLMCSEVRVALADNASARAVAPLSPISLSDSGQRPCWLRFLFTGRCALATVPR